MEISGFEPAKLDSESNALTSALDVDNDVKFSKLIE